MTTDPRQQRALDLLRERVAERREPLSAYYYGFSATGNPGVDLILAAVALAGKNYHDTAGWGLEADEPGLSYVDLIQAAADAAAELPEEQS